MSPAYQKALKKSKEAPRVVPQECQGEEETIPASQDDHCPTQDAKQVRDYKIIKNKLLQTLFVKKMKRQKEIDHSPAHADISPSGVNRADVFVMDDAIRIIQEDIIQKKPTTIFISEASAAASVKDPLIMSGHMHTPQEKNTCFFKPGETSLFGMPGISYGMPGVSFYGKQTAYESLFNSLCPSSPNCVHIKIPGRESICFKDVSDSETIGTLTEKIADKLGVDKQNWGFAAGQREFLPDSKQIHEINHDKQLYFLPKTVIR